MSKIIGYPGCDFRATRSAIPPEPALCIVVGFYTSIYLIHDVNKLTEEQEKILSDTATGKLRRGYASILFDTESRSEQYIHEDSDPNPELERCVKNRLRKDQFSILFDANDDVRLRSSIETSGYKKVFVFSHCGLDEYEPVGRNDNSGTGSEEDFFN